MPEVPIDRRELPARSRGVALSLCGVALICAVAGQVHFRLADATANQQYDVVGPQRDAGLVWYGLAAAATLALCRRTRRWNLWRRRDSCGWRLALVALVCAGGWLRFHRLEALPPGLWIDEALNGVQAIQIAASGRPLVALPPEDVRTGLGAGYVDVAALPFAWFDPDDGAWTLRAVAALLGTAGVAALAALALELFGGPAAVAATGWLAVSQWHLNYSRWGEMPIMSPLLETLLALAIAVGLRARGWRSWCAWLGAGACAGAGLYTYQTFRLFIVLAAVAAVPVALRHRRIVAAHAGGLVGALLVALAVAAPMLHYVIARPAEFGDRARETLIFGRNDWRGQLAESVPRSLLAFQLIGDDNPRHNLPFAPLLTTIPALLAPLGMAICLARWRTTRFAIVPLWFAIAIVPGLITLEAPHATRLLDAIVPLALSLGVAADVVLSVVRAVLPRYLRRLAVAGALSAAALAAAQEYRAYFVARELRQEFVDGFAPWESAPGRYLAAHAPSATVYLDPTTYWSPDTQFVARRYLDTLPNDVRMLRVQHDFPPGEPLARDALYLLPRQYAPFAEVIRAVWDAAQCDEERDAFGRTNLVACRIPSAALAATREQAQDGTLRWRYGLRGRFFASAADGAPIAEAVLPFPFCEYSLDEAPLGRFARAEWDGFIDIPRLGEYRFRLHPDSTSLTIDGQPVITDAGARSTGAGNDGKAVLRAGRLPIRISLDPRREGRYFLWFLWQPPGDDEAAIVPSGVLHPPEQP